MNRSFFVRDALRRDAIRQRQLRARPNAPRPVPPPIGPRARPQRGRARNYNWFGADDEFGAVDSQITMFGIVPMAIAVGAGLWMAFHN